ncbi:serine/arginine repetitive matrix protein [Spatholobus suberectus]|nr:serine/arginine repetitive matrix protein [Spatholobus suberectus]
MGCCFSTPTTQNQNNQSTQKNHHHHEPPPPPLEEESVKEVLTETPISKPHQVPILTPEIKTHLPLLQNPPPNFETKHPIEEISEVVSQLSETCSASISESFSAATTATATREEEEATSKHSIRDGTTANHKWDRSPSRKRPYAADGNLAAGGRERRAKSQARRPDPSPEKKIKGGSRIVRGREMRESGPAANRKRNAGPAALRRDSGEGSGRRSRSPACARKGKMSTGGGRKEVAPASGVEKEKKSEGEEVEVGAGERNDDVVSPEECIENPHVSMECFIFL